MSGAFTGVETRRVPRHHQPMPERVLLIRPSALGDVCRSVPVLASLRRAWPDARIDWLVQDSFADAVRFHPALNRAVLFPRGLLGRTSRRGDLRPALRWMMHQLRPPERYDLALDAQGLFRSALFTRWTGARRRIGYANAAEHAAVFYSERYRVAHGLHAVDRMLRLVAAAGVEPVRDMRLFSDPGERAWVERQPWSVGLPGLARPPGRYVVLAPTSRWPAKQWPAERFVDLARRLLGRGVPCVAIVGGPGEREQIRPLLRWAGGEPRAVDLVGKTSVARLMAIIELAPLVVANDSAALHMAVGFDRPLVALFGPTRVGLVGPYGRDADVIQHIRPADRFDHKHPTLGLAMMERIGVEEVLDACLARL